MLDGFLDFSFYVGAGVSGQRPRLQGRREAIADSSAWQAPAQPDKYCS